MTPRRLRSTVGKVLLLLCPQSKKLERDIERGERRNTNEVALRSHWKNSKGTQWWDFDPESVSLPHNAPKDQHKAIRLFWITGCDEYSLYGHWLIPAHPSRKSDVDFCIKGVFTFTNKSNRSSLWFPKVPDHLQRCFISNSQPERVAFDFLNLCFELCPPFPMCPVETKGLRNVPLVCVPFFVFVFLLSTFSKRVSCEWMSL